MAKKFMTIITTLFIMFVFAACGESSYEELAPTPTPTPTEEPVYVDITVNGDTILLDEDGDILNAQPKRVVIRLKAVPDTAKAAGAEPWALLEGEDNPKTPAYEGLGGSTQWSYNHGNAVVEYSVYAELDNGRKLPLYKPERLKEKQEHVKTETDGSTYSISDVRYSLLLGAQALATTPEVLMTKVGFIDEFLGIKVLRQSHQFGSGSYDPMTGILTCVDTLFYAESWKSGLKNEAFVLVHMQNHISVSTSGNIVVDLSKTVGQSWTGNQANLGGFTITETWISKNIREEKLEVVVNGKTFNLKDSVQHICRWNPDGGKVEKADRIRLDFTREGEPTDRCSAYLDVNIQQKDIKEVKFLETKHWKFPAEADVNTTNKSISVDHKDRAWFELIYNDNSSEKDSILYDVNHLFTYTVVNYIPADLKGKTVEIDANGNVKYNGKVVLTITFKSRTVKNLTYRGKDYTDKAAKCDLTPKKAFFGETTITVTLSHDSENVTAEVPVTYNTLKGYEMVGNPIHDSWNAAYGTSNVFGIRCDNHVVVREVYIDGAKGSSFDLPYKSSNVWAVSGTSFQVESLSSVLNVREDIVNGSASVAGNVIDFEHSMNAEKVSKGTFNYQPEPCEAVAKYITVTSATQARVDIYDGGTKIDEYILPVNITEKEVPITPYTFDGQVLYGWCTWSVIDGPSGVAIIDAAYIHFLVVKNGVYTVYAKKYATRNSDGSINVVYNESDPWASVTIDATQAARVAANHPLAFTGKTSMEKWGFIDMEKTYEVSSDNWGITYMNLLTGSVSRRVGMSGSTIDSGYPYPVLGTWKDGQITINGRTLHINGSEN